MIELRSLIGRAELRADAEAEGVSLTVATDVEASSGAAGSVLLAPLIAATGLAGSPAPSAGDPAGDTATGVTGVDKSSRRCSSAFSRASCVAACAASFSRSAASVFSLAALAVASFSSVSFFAASASAA